MIARLFLLFTVVSLVELYLLVWLGGLIGFWPTLGIVLTTALVGATLSRREGLRVLRDWQKALAEMRVPDEGLTGALLVLVAGIFLITPGILTDIAGLLLLVPPVRRFVAKRLEARFFPRAAAGTPFVDAVGSQFGGSPFGGAANIAEAMRAAGVRPGAGPRAVRVETFRVEMNGPSGRETQAATRVEVVDRGPAKPREPEVLEADVVVDRRGRIVHRSD